MKSIYTVLIGLFCFLNVQNSIAQNLFDVEIYGGLNKNYFQAGEPVSNEDLQISSPLGQHAGLNFLPRINEKWQLSIQGEWMRSAIKLEIPGFNSTNQYNNYGNYAIGARYNLEKEKHAFYFQPSIGVSINNYLDQGGNSFFGVQNQRDAQFIARGEAGVKFYTKNRNYLLLGIRHQQGFTSNTPYGNAEWLGLPLSGRNSYTGLFMGYGINTDNWSKSNRSLRKAAKPQLEGPWENGVYVMGSASLRRVLDPIYDPTDDFQNVSTSFMAGVGYRFGDLSIESGYSSFRGRNVYEIISPEGIPVEAGNRKFSAATIPVTLRYDRQLPINRKIRLGASFTTHFTVNTKNAGTNVISVSGRRIIDGMEYPYEFQVTGLPSDSNGLFFNSGIYTEMPLFRTGLISFKASRNFGSPDFDRANVDYQVSGVPDSFDSQGNLNGWLLEVEYRLPLRHIFK